MLSSGFAGEQQHGGDLSDASQSMLHQDKKTQSTLFAQRALQERRLKPPDQIIACPRCQSLNTKFCYYNNYSLTQPRHFCKNCRRYWTAGGTLRNVPVGGGCRKNKRVKRSTDLSSVLPVESAANGLRGDNGSSTSYPPYNLAMASTSGGYYDHQYEDTKMARHSLTGGPSGVSQISERSGISSSGHVPFSVAAGNHSHGSGSAYEPAGDMLGLGFFSQAKQQDFAGLASGDLNALLEAQTYSRAAAAAAAAGGEQSLMGEGGITYHIDMESLNNIEATDVQWRLQHAAQVAQAAQKQQAIWGVGGGEEGQEHRDGRQVMRHVDEKGLMESLRQAKGKSAMIMSPSVGHDQQGEGPEATRPLTIWQPVPESLQFLSKSPTNLDFGRI